MKGIKYADSPGPLRVPCRPPLHGQPIRLTRGASVFPDPNQFTPSRWLDAKFRPRSFVPFGRGIHRCPGNELAIVIMVRALLEMVARWSIEKSVACEVVPDPRTTLLPRGLRLRLTAHPPRVAGQDGQFQRLRLVGKSARIA